MLPCIQFSHKVLKLHVHIYISLVPRHLKKSEERLVSVGHTQVFCCLRAMEKFGKEGLGGFPCNTVPP